MALLNRLHKDEMRFLTFILFLFFSFALQAKETRMDSLEDFFGTRFALQPPTEQEEGEVFEFIQNFFKKIYLKNTAAAYHQDTSPDFKRSMSYENFRVFIQNFDDLDFNQKHEKFNISFTNNEKSQASYTTLLKGKHPGEQFYLEMTLKKDDDDWKITSIKIYDIYHSKS